MAYTKTIWQKDDVITADKLNNIENGIKSVEDNGLTIGTTASTAKAGNYQPTWAQVTGKPETFEPSEHSHNWADIIGLEYELNFKANKNHTHTISDVTGLQGALNSKANTNDLSTVATSGNYNDLSNKPEILTIGTTATTAKAGNYVPAWSEVTGKPATFAPTVGTTATTAKAGNYQPTAANISDATAIGRTVLTAVDATAVRTAIGAGTGTSNLAIGTTASTAAAGNHNHAITADVDSGLAPAANLQAAFVALSARVKALEDASVE